MGIVFKRSDFSYSFHLFPSQTIHHHPYFFFFKGTDSGGLFHSFLHLLTRVNFFEIVVKPGLEHLLHSGVTIHSSLAVRH